MKNDILPKLLFKYLPITSREQLAFRLDTLKNNRIYFPNYTQLNDPLEGSGYDIKISGYAGCSITENVDDEDIVIAGIRSKYKILCLSETCFSPHMWEHYADNFRGVCFGYWTNGAFSKAQKLKYVSNQQLSETTNANGYVDVESVESEVFNSFFYKHTDWDYEKEYRIVDKIDNQYYEYDSKDLACIILGTNIEESICSCLVQSLSPSVRVFRSKVGYRSFGISLYPFEKKIKYDGSVMDFIRNITELENELTMHNLNSCN